MTPIEFSRKYAFDSRIIDGSYYSGQAISIESGDVVGVVLLNLGGPRKEEDVAPFLYNLFMDPAIIDIPLKGLTRHLLCKTISTLRAKKVAQDYAAIDADGGSPINTLTEDQARALELELNAGFGERNNVVFKTYIAMRYWHPLSEEVARAMEAEGVTKVVLLPLYPHYSKTTTGSSLVYWKALEEKGEIASWPTTYVQEYAIHPKYLEAINARIDEALQKFPDAVRQNVHFLFSAHGTPLKEMVERKDPYCCLVHSTVEHVMRARGGDHPFNVAFQSKVGPAEWLTPSTPDKIEHLANNGVSALLIIPVAFVTDHIETAFELDIEIREEAEELGIEHYEVMGGLNSHPKFITALAEVTAAQLEMNGDSLTPTIGSWPNRQVCEAEDRSTRCENCQQITEARCWDNEEV